MTGICHYNLNAHSVNPYENELKTQMLMSQLETWKNGYTSWQFAPEKPEKEHTFISSWTFLSLHMAVTTFQP